MHALVIGLFVAAASNPKVVVLPTEFFGESPTEVPAGVFDDAVLTAVQAAGDFQVVGRDDLEAVIGLEKQKELLGCNDVSCMAEIAGALDADDLVTVKVAWTDDQWTVTAKLVHLRGTPEVRARKIEFVEGSSADFIRAAQQIIAGLFGAETEAAADWTGFGLQGGVGYGNYDQISGIQLNGSILYRGDIRGSVLGWQARGTAMLLIGMDSGGMVLDLLGDATLRVGPLGPWFAGVGPTGGFAIAVDQPTDGTLSNFDMTIGAVAETGVMLGQRKNMEISVRVRLGFPFDFEYTHLSGMLCAAYVF